MSDIAAPCFGAGITVAAAVSVRFIAEHPEVKVEYFEMVDPRTLAPVESVEERVLVAGAIWLGQTRLIDNLSWPC